MKFLIFFNFLTLLLLAACSGGGSGSGGSSGESNDGDDEIELPTPWTKIFGVTGSSDTYAIDLKIDSEGNSFVISNSNAGSSLKRFSLEGEEEADFIFSSDVEFGAIEIFEDDIYVAGNVYDEGEDGNIFLFDDGEPVTLAGDIDFFICKFSSLDLSVEWCHNYGDLGDTFDVSDLLVTSESIFVAGNWFHDPDPGDMDTPMSKNYLLKFDFDNGAISGVWDRIASLESGLGVSRSPGIAFDPEAQSIYLATSVSGPEITILDGSATSNTYSEMQGIMDIVLVKFDLNLDEVRSTGYGVSDKNYEFGNRSIAVDSNNNVFVSGNTDDSETFTNAGFVLKFNGDTGDLIGDYFISNEVLSTSGVAVEIRPTLQVSSDDQLYVGITIDTEFTGYVVKLDSNLEMIWEKEISNDNNSIKLTNFTISSDNILHIIGTTNHNLFGEEKINSDAGIDDSFITTIHPDGSGDE